MNTWSNKSVTYAELTRRLNDVDRLDAYGNGAILHSFRLNPIGEAQRIILDAGCVLADWDMIEGDFYQLRYIPGASCADIHNWPDEIKLRFISTASLNRPRLVLAYQEANVWKFFGSSGRSVTASATVEARTLIAKFAPSHPGVDHRWYPIFSEQIPSI